MKKKVEEGVEEVEMVAERLKIATLDEVFDNGECEVLRAKVNELINILF